MYQLFHNDCIGFIGDSLQRRAADTLHILIENRKNLSSIDAYICNWTMDACHASRTRVIDSKEPIVPGMYNYKQVCEPGTIDSLWFPTHASFQEYAYAKKHSILIEGHGP
eukprot:scaffold4061_cov108-Cylindrotheca_fusiformis.AAC.19